MAVNTFSGLVHTARHAKRGGNTRSARMGIKVEPLIGAKS